MAQLEHYLYVLECGDGSLYTGYTTDVAARLAAHRSGKGAKYTKSHAPVTLLKQARFYSKQRAMSAEALFKRLSRNEKDTLIALAELEPFENVLRRELPGFGYDTAPEFVRRSLAENSDPEYKDFQSKLIPTIDPANMIGVRTPTLRKIAKELVRRDDADLFLNALPHRLFDENQIHAFAIGLEKNYDIALKRYSEFLPLVDNWATCDQLPVKPLAQQPDKTLEQAKEWMASSRCYTIRFGIGVLLNLYLDERFSEEHLALVACAHMPEDEDNPTLKNDIYYVNMMRAWYFAEALAKQEQAALAYLERTDGNAPLDEWTRRKAIQKAIESRRISNEMKAYLRTLR